MRQTTSSIVQLSKADSCSHIQNFETIILFVSIFLVNILITDGKSNWLEGLMLVALYFIIALAFW